MGRFTECISIIYILIFFKQKANPLFHKLMISSNSLKALFQLHLVVEALLNKLRLRPNSGESKKNLSETYYKIQCQELKPFSEHLYPLPFTHCNYFSTLITRVKFFNIFCQNLFNYRKNCAKLLNICLLCEAKKVYIRWTLFLKVGILELVVTKSQIYQLRPVLLPNFHPL